MSTTSNPVPAGKEDSILTVLGVSEVAEYLGVGKNRVYELLNNSILDHITHYRNQKGWSEYQLATESGLTQSTISSWYRKDLLPSIPSLEKICNAFGITLSQFFSKNEEPYVLTAPQRQLLEASTVLTEEQQLALIEFIKTL